MCLMLILPAIRLLWRGAILVFDPQLALDTVHFDNYRAAVDVDRYSEPEE
jgi:hypothetical protein